ncbi:MAG TPA: hypothetical protein VMT73_09250 [Anaerolineales bacterium]|nr:hypothetical protein [Anaerolineales bacterium]
MVCYYHPDKPAVGLCKHCQRGLCVDCAAIVDDVLACKNRHEEQVRAFEQLTARNLLQAKRVGSVYLRNTIFYGLVGVAFAGFGLWQWKWLGLQAALFTVLGMFLLFAAAMNFAESRKYK